MAEVKKNKKYEKTVNVSMPKTLSKKKIDVDAPVLYSPSRKSRSVESRSYSNEKKKRSGIIADYQQINLDKLDLPDKYSEQKRYASNSSLGSLSPNKRYSQIPIPSRFQMNQRPVSPVKTRSPSPIPKKSPRPSKGKIAPIEPELNLKKLHEPRPPSPIKRIGFVRTSTPKADCKPKSFFSNRGKEDRASDTRNPVPRSPKKKSSKTTLTNERPVSPIKKRITRTPNNSQKSKHIIIEESLSPISQVESSKIANRNIGERTSAFEGLNIPDSMSLDLFGELCPSKGSFFDLDGKKSETGMFIPLTLKLSQDSCRRSPSVIRTISGHELVLTPSLELDMEKEALGDIAFSQLLKETEEKLDDKFNKLQVFHDDANEYDSEATTDSIPIFESKIRETDPDRKHHSKYDGNKARSWKNHEDELLNDVSYRQSVYHPAVIRHKNQEERAMLDGRPKSGLIEDNFGCSGQTPDSPSRNRNTKNNFKRKHSPTSWNRNPGVPNIRSWNEKNIELNCKEVCKELEKMKDCPSSLVKEIKRERTKKERIAGALLRLVAKTIRLLVIFNIWPGGNIFLLTSNLLRSR